MLVIGYRGRLTPAEADAHTLLTLATLHRIASADNPPRVVAEVVDSRNADIARATGADDLVVSDRLSSLLLAQLAERPTIKGVFDELFDPAGASIELWRAEGYLVGEAPFSTVVAAARLRGEVAIGYRLVDGTVTINPAKASIVTLRPEDRIVLLARQR